MSLSFKWRIAAAYASLLVVVLIATSGLLFSRFRAILYDQARQRVNTTVHEIVQAARSTDPFASQDLTVESILPFFTSANLETWASPSTFVQVDTLAGYPIARTSNLGGIRIPPNANLSSAHDTAYRTIAFDGHSVLVEDRLLRSGSSGAIIHVAEPLDALERTLAATRDTIALVLFGAVVAVIVLSFAIASRAIAPIARLSRAMREIGSDRLDRRLDVARRDDEIGELMRSFNDLLARLEEAFARERQFISDASHELKTPLTSINANAQLLLRWGDRDERVRIESLETIEHESATLAEMVNGMLTLAKADRGDAIPKEPLSLAHVAQEALRSCAARAAEKGLALEYDGTDASTIVEGDAHLLRQLVGNLIENAIKFTTTGHVRVALGADGAHAWVEVHDTGPGIPDEELGRVFERFYRADKARSRDVPGTGLGLAIVRSIARVHGGTVEARRSPDGGACIRATLPRLDPTLTADS
ncbi:MAG: HAMP domain-containing histidine kinase [bacterium]|nr:HAMP domain-containing histidine kinase [bacterium]